MKKLKKGGLIIHWILLIIIVVVLIAAGILYFMKNLPNDNSLEKITENQIQSGIELDVKSNQLISLETDGMIDTIGFDIDPGQQLELIINGEPSGIILQVGHGKNIDIDSDGNKDLRISILEISDGITTIRLNAIEPTACEERWECDEWNTCVNGIQTRTCTDQNNCNTLYDKPDTSNACCSWECDNWQACLSNNMQIRYCEFHQNCVLDELPPVQQACDYEMCNSEDYKGCYQGDVYWFDSCGNIDHLSYECFSNQECINGICQQVSCSQLSGQDCQNGYGCEGTEHTTTDVNNCCVGSCESVLCDLEDAEQVAAGYIEASLANDYETYSTLTHQNCEIFPSLCELGLETLNGAYSSYSTIDLQIICPPTSSNRRIARYLAIKDGDPYNLGIVMQINYEIGGCRVLNTFGVGGTPSTWC